ncbi:MAG: hypothetical protein KC431_18730, partial [Myxococcales bacterium]|nr:hypothetical protein [Myxococcales bacterium]
MGMANSERSEDQDLELAALLTRLRPRRVAVLTGAGISLDSGIPTFRDEGDWAARSSASQESPAELAYFRRHPREAWTPRLRMRERCRRAEPNAGHRALAALERALGEEFLLVTQNIDGLHRRAGSSDVRTIEVHGDVDHMRALDGAAVLRPIPDGVVAPDLGEVLDDR